MKKIVIILCYVLLFFSKLLYSQDFLTRDTTGIKTITEISGRHKNYFHYNKSGYLIGIDYDVVKYTYDYNLLDTVVIVTELLIDKTDNDTTEYVNKIYYDSLNRICKVEINIYGNFSNYDDDYYYNGDSEQVIKKIHRIYSKDRSTFSCDTTFYEYYNDNRVTVCLETTHLEFDPEIICNRESLSQYGIRKNMYSKIDYLTYKIDLFIGDRGSFRYNHYSKYDKKGNWRRRFRIYFIGEKQVNKRKIKYWD